MGGFSDFSDFSDSQVRKSKGERSNVQTRNVAPGTGTATYVRHGMYLLYWKKLRFLRSSTVPALYSVLVLSPGSGSAGKDHRGLNSVVRLLGMPRIVASLVAPPSRYTCNFCRLAGDRKQEAIALALSLVDILSASL